MNALLKMSVVGVLLTILSGVAVCCSVLQCVAVCCSVLLTRLVDLLQRTLQVTKFLGTQSVLQCVAVCCSVLQCVDNIATHNAGDQVSGHSK